MHSLATQDLSQRTVETHSDCGFFVRALLSAFADIAQPFQVHADARLVGLHLAWGWSPELMHVIWSSNGGHGLTRCSCEGDAVQMGRAQAFPPGMRMNLNYSRTKPGSRETSMDRRTFVIKALRAGKSILAVDSAALI